MNSPRFQTAGIGLRLGAAFGLLALLLMGSVGFGVLRLASLQQSVYVLDDAARASVLAATLVAQAHETSGALGRAVMADAIDVVQANLKQAQTLRTDITSNKKRLADALSDVGARTALAAVLAAEPAYRAGVDKVTASITSGDTDAARQALNDPSLRKTESVYLATLDKLDTTLHAGIEVATTQAADAYQNGRNMLFGAALVATATAAALGLWITRSLTGPAAQAVAAATRIAEGDLTQDLRVSRRDEMGHILTAMNDMQTSLRDVVGGVRRGSDSIANASAEIAQGNQELSARTEAQASALEQTAASMEELGSTVRQNADNAKQANQLALGAAAVASRGGEVVGQVVMTMRGINDSSKQIADIISVIDGIAFQTNILALNAAVEAARAGEQGRGFAVVASEVRSLAGRSADAARAIKGLITASVERVEKGTALVDQAGVTMSEVVASIKRVTDIMAEISAASSEQSAGVAQVGEAVNQMDKATQQNAALVEESAAAAESLRVQAQTLVHAVSVFKLEQTA
jgi:methyl-accepting chemotaxis protein